MQNIERRTAGIKHRDGSWEILGVDVAISEDKMLIRWPPKVSYKGKFYNLIEGTLEKRPLYAQEEDKTEKELEKPPLSDKEKAALLERYCDKQSNQINALLYRIKQLERDKESSDER